MPCQHCALLGVLAASACAGTVSSFQPAHVAPAGHAQAELGYDVVVPTGTIVEAIDVGKALADAAGSRSLGDLERQDLVAAGAALLLNPPSVVFHTGASYTPLARWELGLRYAAGGWRAATRYQLFEQESDGVDFSAGLGVQRFTAKFPLENVIRVLGANALTRWSLDVPIVAGRHARWYRWWGGPRIILSHYSAGMTLSLPNEPAQAASVEGNALHVGGIGGVAIGYRFVFVAFELAAVRLLSTAHLQLRDQRTDVDLGSWVIAPGIGLLGEF